MKMLFICRLHWYSPRARHAVHAQATGYATAPKE